MQPHNTGDMPELTRRALREAPFYARRHYLMDDAVDGADAREARQRADEDAWWSAHVYPVLVQQRQLVAEDAANMIRTHGLDGGGDQTARFRDWLARKVEQAWQLTWAGI